MSLYLSPSPKKIVLLLVKSLKTTSFLLLLIITPEILKFIVGGGGGVNFCLCSNLFKKPYLIQPKAGRLFPWKGKTYSQ